MRAENERRYDDYERMAIQALMIEKAHREKRPKLTDLFKRPNDKQNSDKKTIDERRKEVDEINAWLSTLTTERRG
ncbi:hypothetical protein Q8A72_06775 [Aeribacillus pallidus]|nr:hypothetical protein [Aeribacillus pallidus]